MLHHISEEAGIRRFDPRPHESFAHHAVWAIDADHLRNYLLPRDCPRVTFYRVQTSTADDVRQFLWDADAVVAFERRWLARVRSCILYRYHLPPTNFVCVDPGAGYFVSTESVMPSAVDTITDALQAIADNGASTLVVDDLWPLHDAITKSSLQFSMIRMRNAQPPVS